MQELFTLQMSDCSALKVTNIHSFGKEAEGGFISTTKIPTMHLIMFMLPLLC